MKIAKPKSVKRIHAESGQALVEFAMTIPMLALLLFGIIQYGFIFGAYTTLRHAAYVVSREASLSGFDSSNSSNVNALVAQNISPMLDPANLDPVALTSTSLGSTPAITVQATYHLPLIVKFVVPGATAGTMTINANATYRKN